MARCVQYIEGMEAEPEYKYVRGQGWVVGPYVDTFTGTSRNGESWRIEVRYPRKGEIWDACHAEYDTAEKVYYQFVGL